MSVLLKYRKDLFLKNGLLYQKVMLKNHSEPRFQFVLPKNFVCKVILVCHDDNGHLGMEKNIRTITGTVLLAKNGRGCVNTYPYL